MGAVLKRVINHVSKSNQFSIAKLSLVVACKNEVFSASNFVKVRNSLGAELIRKIKLVVQNEIIIALFKVSKILVTNFKLFLRNCSSESPIIVAGT